VTYRKYALKQGNRIAVRFIKYDIQGVFLLVGVEVLLLRSEKKNNRLYGDTQRRDFRPLEDKRYLW
jgi:hypothetical protein